MKRLILLAIIISFLFAACNNNQHFTKIYIDKDKSFLNDFTILGDYVIYDCTLTIINNSKTSEISIEAIDLKEYKRNLLKSPTLSSKEHFLVNSGENVLHVKLSGLHGTENTKFDRLLPNKISIIIVYA